MLYDFAAHIQELREDSEERGTIEEYEEIYGPIKLEITAQPFYKDYLSRIWTIPFDVPEELSDDFDWPLLQRLIAGSMASDCRLARGRRPEERPRLIIRAENEEKEITEKALDRLWGFQILRLFEVYINEQICLATLRKDSAEWNALVERREERLVNWNRYLLKLENSRTQRRSRAKAEK